MLRVNQEQKYIHITHQTTHTDTRPRASMGTRTHIVITLTDPSALNLIPSTTFFGCSDRLGVHKSGVLCVEVCDCVWVVCACFVRSEVLAWDSLDMD